MNEQCIRKAAEYARQAHEGTYRKGTKIPYITHPQEVALIADLLSDGDPTIIAAAYLHDTIEDTDTTYEDLKEQFGPEVADLVAVESEDKAKTWKERKQATIDHLSTLPREAKIIALADKLSNLRSMAKDQMMVGEALWERFRVKEKSCHAWYYTSMLPAFAEFEGTLAYTEYKILCARVFGK